LSQSATPKPSPPARKPITGASRTAKIGTPTKEDRRGILEAVDPNVRVFVLVILAMEAAFGGALAFLPKESVALALVVMAVVFVIAMSATLWLYRMDRVGQRSDSVRSSDLTVASPFLEKLVTGAIETVCRAVSLPETPDAAQLRVFIFRVEQGYLKCTHFWALNPTQEQVGLRFDLRADLASKVAVVDAALNRRIARTKVSPIPSGTEGVRGEVDPELSFVLAAPIYTENNDVWGVVDFDTRTSTGQALLSNEVSDQVMIQLARHLRVIFSN
jgi:hypothetical protein